MNKETPIKLKNPGNLAVMFSQRDGISTSSNCSNCAKLRHSWALYNVSAGQLGSREGGQLRFGMI